MRIGDKVFVRIAHIHATGVIVDINRNEDGIEYLVKVGNRTHWIPEKDCSSADALDRWSSEPTTR